MTQPLPPRIAVALGIMRDEADIWVSASDRLDAVARDTPSQRIDLPLVYPLWNEFLSVYHQVTGIFGARTQEGSARTGELGTALRSIADVYENEERANLHTMHD